MNIQAVVLLSGGADSVTCLAWAVQERGLSCLALSFDYGQTHKWETLAARRAAETFRVPHRTARLDPSLFSASALTGGSPIPKGRTAGEIGRGIPSTYVPARNLVFLSLAAALAETLGAETLVIGVNALDYSGYPDCRPEFLRAFQKTLRVGTRSGVEGRPTLVEAPLLEMKKAEIFLLGTRLGVDYSLTVSCYDADEQGRACGACDACLLRARGFREAGLPDPTRYKPGVTPPSPGSSP
ncbi:MAG TPA: 7-cyano-7-deazaguanine synthase QueC [Planctomycetes bacterium]|nr:7-cyano-7-deazaguanine synthase QueC [Planctomycetota bacterium]